MTSRDVYFFGNACAFSSRKAVSVPTSVIGGLGAPWRSANLYMIRFPTNKQTSVQVRPSAVRPWFRSCRRVRVWVRGPTHGAATASSSSTKPGDFTFMAGQFVPSSTVPVTSVSVHGVPFFHLTPTAWIQDFWRYLLEPAACYALL